MAVLSIRIFIWVLFKVLQKFLKPRRTALTFTILIYKLTSEAVKLTSVELPSKTGLHPETDVSVVKVYARFMCALSYS